MDPERVKAYLQAACAGLGFDIGEIWWTSSENGSSTVAAIEEPLSDSDESEALSPSSAIAKTKKKYGRKLRFVQLYTSKSFESRRSQLINPPDELHPELRRGSSSESLEEHVLSPRLVDAISKSAQVVWANTRKREGLTGRSDIRLQTAVGMPVAVDSNGNMCVVVMFSPNNIQSSDDALEYLQSISHSATATDIPCLLPVVDARSSGLKLLPPAQSGFMPEENPLGEGVTTRFVSLEEPHRGDGASSPSSEPEVHSEHELSSAPKDTFGIPMLPTFAELGNVIPEENIDVFDEASYGIWTTIMDSLKDDCTDFGSSQPFDLQRDSDCPLIECPEIDDEKLASMPTLDEAQKQRLEEFCSAFLGMSVFDLAEIWIPAGSEFPDCLRPVMSVVSSTANSFINDFKQSSERSLIKFWTGAVGRAFSSGNPVWSANPAGFMDPFRTTAFQNANIRTVLAVPVYPDKGPTPACVVACYSLVRSSSAPFVLRFVQQALRLLWHGLEHVEPHESVGKEIWREIAPADLGEMAADVEMQQHFLNKKRPHNVISEVQYAEPEESDLGDEYTTGGTHLQQVTLPNGETIMVPLQLAEVGIDYQVPDFDASALQSHVVEAVRSIGNAVPFDHVATNKEGTKRAHVMGTTTTERISFNSPQGLFLAGQLLENGGNMSFNSGEVLIGTGLGNDARGSQDPTMVGPQVTMVSFGENLYQYCAPTSESSSVAPESVSSADISLGSSTKMCRIQGCDELAVSRRPYCVKHSGNRLCEHNGCGKCAQGSTRFCIAHGGGRRCTFPGCDKGARDKFFCAAHGGGKRCHFDGCTKSAVGGSNLCTAHGGGRRCAVEGCDKSAQSSTRYCVKHGGGKKCAHHGCDRVARGRTQYCASHGGGVRCKLEGCNRVAIGKMQLCRAHGGGSRGGGSNGRRTASNSPTLTPLGQENDFFNNHMEAYVNSPDHMTTV